MEEILQYGKIVFHSITCPAGMSDGYYLERVNTKSGQPSCIYEGVKVCNKTPQELKIQTYFLQTYQKDDDCEKLNIRSTVSIFGYCVLFVCLKKKKCSIKMSDNGSSDTTTKTWSFAVLFAWTETIHIPV